MRKIPKFKNEEEREFWGTHSVVDYLNELKGTNEIRRCNDKQTKKLASVKGVDVSTLIRSWIKEHVDKDLKTA